MTREQQIIKAARSLAKRDPRIRKLIAREMRRSSSLSLASPLDEAYNAGKVAQIKGLVEDGEGEKGQAMAWREIQQIVPKLAPPNWKRVPPRGPLINLAAALWELAYYAGSTSD